MEDWIKIDSAEFNRPTASRVGEDVVMTSVSPHDVPTAVRFRFDKERDELVTEFRYIDDEPTREQVLERGVIVRVGRHSMRLFGFVVPRSVVESTAGVQFELDDACDRVIARFKERTDGRTVERMGESYDIARRVVHANAPSALSAP